MSIETSIETALFARAAALVLSPAWPVAWPNATFTPVLTGYLAVSHLPNVSRRLYIGSGEPHQRMGILQVSVFAPLNQGASKATEVGGKIAAWFPTDLSLVDGGVEVRVTKAPDVLPALRETSFWHVPVRISYECLA